MAYKAVLYDMDGTVLNSLLDLTDSVNYSLAKFGFPEVSMEHVRRTLGNGAAYLIRNCLPQGTDEETVNKVLEFYKPYYREHSRIKTAPYDGITELMKEMKTLGIKQAVVSNKPDATARDLADIFFSGCLELAIGEKTGISRKPAPDMVLAAIEMMGMEKRDCVYIGDTEVDIKTAANAGIDCIAVTWGFRDVPQLKEAGAERFAGNADELKAELLK